MSKQTEYGRLSTLHDHVLYAILEEHRKTNELMKQLLEKVKPEVVVVESLQATQIPSVVEESPKRRGKQRDR